MTQNPETVPLVWTTADETFFHLVQRMFDSSFLAGGSVLLASYDDEAPEMIDSEPIGSVELSSTTPPVRAFELAPLNVDDAQ